MTSVGSISSADSEPVSEGEVSCLIGHGLPECIALGKAATECEMLANGALGPGKIGTLLVLLS